MLISIRTLYILRVYLIIKIIFESHQINQIIFDPQKHLIVSVILLSQQYLQSRSCVNAFVRLITHSPHEIQMRLTTQNIMCVCECATPTDGGSNKTRKLFKPTAKLYGLHLISIYIYSGKMTQICRHRMCA